MEFKHGQRVEVKIAGMWVPAIFIGESIQTGYHIVEDITGVRYVARGEIR